MSSLRRLSGLDQQSFGVGIQRAAVKAIHILPAVLLHLRRVNRLGYRFQRLPVLSPRMGAQNIIKLMGQW